MTTLILGGTTFTNCQQALVLRGKEVFRLRQRGGDGQLVADFDLCDESGKTIAKVARNDVVAASPGTAVRHGPTFSEVVDAQGMVIGRAEEVAPDVVRVIGTFGSAGTIVRAKADALELPNQGVMHACSFSGVGAAIEIDGNGSISLGRSAPPPARPGFRQKPVAPKLRPQGKRRR